MVHESNILPDQSAPSNDQLSKAGLEFFFNLADKWGLNRHEQKVLLGDIPNSTFTKWKRDQNGKLSRDHLDRISYLMGIFKAINILLPTEQAANAWIKKPNDHALFNGGTALSKMMRGSIVDLADIRRYLDYERGG